MPANFAAKSSQTGASSIYLAPAMKSNIPQRRVSTESNGYASGTDTSPNSTPNSSKLISCIHPISVISGGERQVPTLPDLRRPPPKSVLDVNGSTCLNSCNTEGISCFLIQGIPPSSTNHNNNPLIEVAPFASVSMFPASADIPVILNTGTAQNLGHGHLSEEIKRPGCALTPDMFKMSPCLRPDSSPCADDLGNYAMHVSQMELVWHGEFDRLFAQYYPHAWYLVPTFYPPSDRWRVFKDSAKVRFSCQECGHGWTSMKGRVIFWFHLNYTTNSGYVMFKLYGQQCQKCKNGSYEHAMWYPEEVVKVIGNVYNRVGQIFYGFVRPPLRIDRRQGKPRNQHNADLCQACKEGLCKEEWSFS